MIVAVQTALEQTAIGAAGQCVRLARNVRTEIDRGITRRAGRRRIGTRRARIGAVRGRGRANLELGETTTQDRVLTALIILVEGAEFGRKLIRPVAVQLEHAGMQAVAADIAVGLQAQAGGGDRGVLTETDRVLGVQIRQRRTLRIRQVGVEACGQTIVAILRIVQDAAGIVIVARLRDRRDLVDRGIGQQAAGITDVRDDGAGIVLDRAFHDRSARADPLARDHEEQLVLDDRTGQFGAEILELERGQGDATRGDARSCGGFLAPQLVGRIGIEAGAVEAVGTRLQNGVDRAALEIAFAHVIGRDLGLELADGVERNGAATGGQAVGVQAEIVGDRHAVDREAVEARILARERDGTTRTGSIVEAGERIAAHQVADVAVDAGYLRDIRCGQNGHRAQALRTGASDRRSGNDDLSAAALTICGQLDRQFIRKARHGEDIRDAGFLIAGSRDGDGERTAHAQTGGREGAVRARNRRGRGTRGNVDDRDRRARNRRAVGGDGTAD